MKAHFSPRVFMLVPTMACQAQCRYCYAQKEAGTMSRETLDAAIEWIDRITAGKSFRIIFHGGEPLLPGAAFYREALPKLRERFGLNASLAVQSNLWALDEELIELFKAYNVSLSTSLDGPQDMCDSQRGSGYYEKTQAGIRLAKTNGINPGRICTFSALHADMGERVFREAEAPYTIHGAIQTLGEPVTPLTISPEQFTRVLLDTLHAYTADPAHCRVSLLDSMAQAVLYKKCGLCTFKECLGEFAAITPSGDIYSCQRFSGNTEFCIGNVRDMPDESVILSSPGFRRLFQKYEETAESCHGCGFWESCHGGCIYSSFASDSPRDPYCETYKAVFNEMLLEIGKETAGEMLGRNDPVPLLCMAGDKPHPYDERMKKQRLRAALEYGKTPGSNLPQRGDPANQLNKVFFNLTRRCPLHCAHCWEAGRDNDFAELSPERWGGLVQQAVDMRFRRIVITGGEPLVYPQFDRFMEILGKIRRKGSRLILRSSFAFAIPEERMRKIGRVFDLVIVSIDGSPASHDARRGAGAYEKAVQNLETFTRLVSPEKAGLWSVLSSEQQHGPDGDSVRALGKRLGIRFIRFDVMKPMGGGCFSECDTTEALPEHAEDLRIRGNCGLGHLLHVEPDGSAYPCYAIIAPQHKLADLATADMPSLKESLLNYCNEGVDRNEKCRNCDIRYLCGGLCCAYRPDPTNLRSGEFDCEGIASAIRSMLI